MLELGAIDEQNWVKGGQWRDCAHDKILAQDTLEFWLYEVVDEYGCHSLTRTFTPMYKGREWLRTHQSTGPRSQVRLILVQLVRLKYSKVHKLITVDVFNKQVSTKRVEVVVVVDLIFG